MTKVKFTAGNAGDLLSQITDAGIGIIFNGQLFLFQYREGTKYIRLDEYPNRQTLKPIAKKAYQVFREANPPYEWENPLNGVVKTVTPRFHGSNLTYGEYLKICKSCKSFYYCQNYRAKYCSDDCNPGRGISSERKQKFNHKYYAKKRKVKHEPRQCLVCSDWFTPHRDTKKVCSDKCRQVLSRNNKKIKSR